MADDIRPPETGGVHPPTKSATKEETESSEASAVSSSTEAATAARPAIVLDDYRPDETPPMSAVLPTRSIAQAKEASIEFLKNQPLEIKTDTKNMKSLADGIRAQFPEELILPEGWITEQVKLAASDAKRGLDSVEFILNHPARPPLTQDTREVARKRLVKVLRPRKYVNAEVEANRILDERLGPRAD